MAMPIYFKMVNILIQMAKAVIQAFLKFFLFFYLFLYIILMYVLTLYFLHDAYTTLTCTTYNTYITIQLR